MIQIINPPNPPKAVSNKDMMGGMGQLYPAGAPQKVPTLDILYAASVLRSRGIPVHVIDCLASDLDLSELIIYLLDRTSEYVAIRTSTPTFDWDIQVARVIKLVTRSKIILFGSHLTLFPRLALQHPFVDAVIVGEAELAFPDIIERGEFGGCEGVWYRDNDEVVEAGSCKPIIDLDALPFPAWDLVPYHAYDGTEQMRGIKPFVTALTSRGCPYACSYCPYPVAQGRQLRVRSPGNVVDELTWLANSLQVKAVLFRDPEFALQRSRVVGICESILKRNIKIAWRCETRVEDLDDDLLALMACAGCIGINMGIESADPQVLKNMHRNAVPLEESQRIVKACKRYGIDTFCFFILGLPGEDAQSALMTIRYAVKLNPTTVQFTVATPYPGTEFRRWAESQGYIEDSASIALTSYNAAVRNEHLTIQEIRWLQTYAHETLAMRWPRVARRIRRSGEQTAFEIVRWFNFQIGELRQRGFKKTTPTLSELSDR